MGFGGSNGGGSSIAGSSDVALSNPTNNELLSYNSATNKWTNLELADFNVAPTFWRTWNGTSWSARPTTPTGVPVTAYSTTDENAPPPPNPVVGDIWERHPLAV